MRKQNSEHVEIKTKGVTFNVLDPDQKKLFDHAMKRPNFSGYVKRLIQRDLDGKQMVVHQVGGAQQPPQGEEEWDPDLLDGMI